MEEILNQISVNLIRDRAIPVFISKIHLHYTYGQMKLSEQRADNAYSQTKRSLVEITVPKNGFTDLPLSHKIRQKNQRRLEYSTSA